MFRLDDEDRAPASTPNIFALANTLVRASRYPDRGDLKKTVAEIQNAHGNWVLLQTLQEAWLRLTSDKALAEAAWEHFGEEFVRYSFKIDGDSER